MTQDFLTRSLDSVVSFNGREHISFGEFLVYAGNCAAELPPKTHLINLCEDRLLFSIVFFAAILRNQSNVLLPASSSVVRKSAAQSFPDSYVLQNAAVRELMFSGCADPAQVIEQLNSVPRENVAAVVFSSGTTGLQKQINKTWGSLLVGARINSSYLQKNLAYPASVIATVPHWHMYGLEWTVMLPLVADLAICVKSALFPEDIRCNLELAEGRRVLLSTPLHLRALLESGLDVPEVELVMSATSPLAPELALRIEREWRTQCLEIYGCSELGSMAFRSPANDERWCFYSEFAADVDGSCVTLTGEHTGDGVRLADHLEFDEQGRFVILGRDHEMVKVAGKRGSLADITASVLSIDGVLDCVIYEPATLGLHDTGRLAAVLVTNSLSSREVRQHLKDLVDPVFLPRPILITDRIPRSKTGKLRQTDLRRLIDAVAGADLHGS